MVKSKNAIKNSKALAAILSAGVGSFVLGLYAFMVKNRRRCAKQVDIMIKSKNAIKNGKALAAILSAGIGSFILGFFAFIAELNKTVKELLTFYPPSGSLSGISTLAVIGWLISWAVLYFAWRNHDVNFNRVFIIGLILIGLGLLFMFPPFIDVFK